MLGTFSSAAGKSAGEAGTVKNNQQATPLSGGASETTRETPYLKFPLLK